MESFSFILIVSKAEEEQQQKLCTIEEVIDVVCHEKFISPLITRLQDKYRQFIGQLIASKCPLTTQFVKQTRNKKLI